MSDGLRRTFEADRERERREIIARLNVENKLPRAWDDLVRERLVRARVENIVQDLRWLVECGNLNTTDNAFRFAVNAQANAEALARKVGVL